MLQSLKHLYGKTLGTSDDEIGSIKDFYFDDQRWAVRYVVADTGSWLSGRLVLLSPHAFGNFCQDGDSLLVSLSRKQIKESPAIETHKPVSRQYEEDYYSYYGWSPYWSGAEMWGASGLPLVPPPQLVSVGPKSRDDSSVNGDEPHLRSAQAVSGYHIQTPEGEIGHVIDFMIDDQSWEIRRLVVETGHWYAGKEIVISPTQVERISYEESKVFVNVTKEAIQNAPEYVMPPSVDHASKNFDDRAVR